MKLAVLLLTALSTALSLATPIAELHDRAAAAAIIQYNADEQCGGNWGPEVTVPTGCTNLMFPKYDGFVVYSINTGCTSKLSLALPFHAIEKVCRSFRMLTWKQ
jgi:hypothetical protein